MTNNKQEFSVSEISAALKRVVEGGFSYVRVRGEISGLKVASSGHVYFSLKDEKAVLNAICWKYTAPRLAFRPKEGMEVICTGKITTYEGRSNYQIIIENMEEAGVGNLMMLLEKRKQKFIAEGLFDNSRKKDKPYLPKTIGVVTSETGSVIRDILHRITDRFPSHVIVYPAPVQGEGAAEKIAHAIKRLHHVLPRPDVIIVARGGGSIEDLWAFNEDAVVYAVSEAEIPIISAVGHETDTTLIDYVADYRAPTPTAAAEIAVPVKSELTGFVLDTESRMFGAISKRINLMNEVVSGVSRGILNPKQIIETAMQRLDEWNERLSNTVFLYISQKNRQLEYAGVERIKPIVLRNIESKDRHLEHAASMLSSLNYKNVLSRGFSIVRSGDKIISSSKHLKKGDLIDMEFGDGKQKAVVE